MSLGALDRLIAREQALVAALDEGDAPTLQAAAQGVADALGEVAAAGSWNAHSALGARVMEALRLADAARARIAWLADRNRRQLDRLAALTGAPRTHAYSRRGRLG